VQVLEDEDDRLADALTEEQALHGVDAQAAAVLGVLGGGQVIAPAEEVQKPRYRVPEALVQGQEAADHLLPHVVRVIVVADAEVAAEEVDEGQVRRRLPEGDGERFQGETAGRAVQPFELQEQAGLADAGVADDAHDLAVPLLGQLQRLLELVQFAGPPHEGGEAAPGAGLEPRPDLRGAQELVGVDGLAAALHRHRPQGRPAEVVLGEGVGGAGDEDGIGLGEALHAGSEADGVSDRGVVQPEVAADGADNDLAGVDANPHLDDGAPLAPYLLAIARHRVADSQGGVKGAPGGVLVGDGGAEEGHDAVAEHVVDRALVAVDGVHHQRDGGVHQPPRLLEVDSFQQLHRAAEVREQRRHLLALSLQRCAGGQYLAGQVRGGKAGRRTVVRPQRRAAAPAEPGGDAHRRPARGADALEASAALLAEGGGFSRGRPATRAA